MQTTETKELQKKIDIDFAISRYSSKLLMHPSYRHEHAEVHFDNKSLEFLGDAVLGLISANCLIMPYQLPQRGIFPPHAVS